MYGASKQSKDNASAQAQNTELQAQQNNAAWQNWLATKGVGSSQPVVAGQMPSDSYAVNTRLPYWASVNAATGQKVWRKAGATPKVDTLNTTLPKGAATPDTGAADGAATATSQPSTGQKLANVLDPLNLTVGNNRNNFFDPLGIFCWAAREAYGEHNPKWRTFREWMIDDAPAELRQTYGAKGSRLAGQMRESPMLKSRVLAIMDGIFSADIDAGTPAPHLHEELKSLLIAA